MQRMEYSYAKQRGRMYFKKYECADMSTAIELFSAIDPSVQVIETFAGRTPDTIYQRVRGAWVARMPQRMAILTRPWQHSSEAPPHGREIIHGPS
jgi:hypothetical protein